jgi:hypothetical protein
MATLGTFTAGQVLTAAELNAGLPCCLISNSTSVSIASGSLTEITYDSDDNDNYGWHSTSLNTGRITPDIPGIYLAVFRCTTPIINGRLLLLLRKNGSVELGRFDVTSTSNEGATVSRIMELNGTTDYVNTYVEQTSGTAKSVTPNLSLVWIAGA